MRKLLVGYFFSLLALIVIGQSQVHLSDPLPSENTISALQGRDEGEKVSDERLIKKPKSSNHEKEFFKIDATEIREQEEDDEKELDSFKKRLERSKYQGDNHDKIAVPFLSLRQIASAERDFSYLTESERYLLILVFRI